MTSNMTMTESRQVTVYEEGMCSMTGNNILYMALLVFTFISLLSIAESSYAQQAVQQQKLNQCPVYGQYWRSYKWGWYGAKRIVRTPVEAYEILQQFYVAHKGVRIHRIIEGPTFYRADIMDKNGALVDMVIIDKNTGRIRSIY